MKNIFKGKSTLSETDIGILVPPLVNGTIPTEYGGSAGGIGGGGGDLADLLYAAELGMAQLDKANTIIDTFNTEYGTKINMLASTSALHVSPLETNGSYTRLRKTGTPVTSCDAKLVISFQAFKPQELIVSNTIKFAGDWSSYFVEDKTLVIYKIVESEDQKVLAHIYNTDKQIVKLVITSVSYNSGSDETSIVVVNTEGYDLNIGLSTNEDVQSYLRVVPFDFKVYSSVDDSATWEEMDIDDITSYNGGFIGLPGEGFTKEVGLTTGTNKAVLSRFSENKIYGIILSFEKTSGNDYLVAQYSIDRGRTWNYFGGSKSSSQQQLGNAVNNEFGGEFYRCHSGQIAVANNGKFVFSASINMAGLWAQLGRYGDLSITTPVLNYTADSGTGAGPGYIAYDGSNHHTTIGVGFDKEDLSYVAFVCGCGTHASSSIKSFSAGGATFLGSKSISFIPECPAAVAVTGTSGNHVLHAFAYNPGTSTMLTIVINETDPTNATYSDTSLNLQNYIWGFTQTANYLIALIWTSSDFKYVFKNLGTGTILNYLLSSWPTEYQYSGWSTAQAANAARNILSTVVADPNDEKHCFFITEHADCGYYRNFVLFHEIKDITNNNGILIQQQDTSSARGWRSSSSQQWLAQTFQATSTKIGSVSFVGYQQGNIASGKKAWIELWNTSAGAPTSIISASAVSNEIDPSLVTPSSSNWQFLYFTFEQDIALTIGQTYAIVLKGDWTPGGDCLILTLSASNPYANGSEWEWNGSTWTNNSTYDLAFQIFENRTTDITQSFDSSQGRIGKKGIQSVYGTEGSIALIDDTNIQIMYKSLIRTFTGNPSEVFVSGAPHRRLVNINSGSGATIGEITPGGYSKQDDNLIWNISFGHDDAYRKNTVTGVSENYPIRSRASRFCNTVGVQLNTPTRIADSDFESGYCIQFNTSGDYCQYALNDFRVVAPFNASGKPTDMILELELKLGTATGNARTIYDARATQNIGGWNFGFMVYINNSGYLEAYMGNGSSWLNKVASDKTEPIGVYYKVRVVRIDGVWKLYRSESAPFTVFTEVSSYSSSSADNAVCEMNTSELAYIGNDYNHSTNFINGKIGYFKYALGTSSFAYDGYNSQFPIADIQNHGHAMTAKRMVGYNDGISPYNNQLDIPVVGNGQESSMVDSYSQLLTMKKTHDTAGKNLNFKLEKGRGTDADVSKINGIVAQFSK